MSIVTKKGDTGKTGLLAGADVAKDSLRVEFNGVLDELNSFLAMSVSCVDQKKIKDDLMSIRRDLFVIGTEAATPVRFLKRLKQRLGTRNVAVLEKEIKELEKKLKTKARCFSVTDEGMLSSVLNVSRAVARKLERRAVTMARKRYLKNKHILVYLNRLSDLLFLMALCLSEDRRHQKMQ